MERPASALPHPTSLALARAFTLGDADVEHGLEGLTIEALLCAIRVAASLSTPVARCGLPRYETSSFTTT